MTENGLNSTFVIEHRTFATVMGDYLKKTKTSYLTGLLVGSNLCSHQKLPLTPP